MDERQQPGTRLSAFRHEAVGIPPRREETLLHGILGELLVAQDAERKTVGHPSEAVVQLGQGRVVGACDHCDDGLVRQVGERTGPSSEECSSSEAFAW